MNRAERRRAAREGRLCEHGYAKKTNDYGRPYCPHGCGFPHSQRPPAPQDVEALVRDDQ